MSLLKRTVNYLKTFTTEIKITSTNQLRAKPRRSRCRTSWAARGCRGRTRSRERGWGCCAPNWRRPDCAERSGWRESLRGCVACCGVREWSVPPWRVTAFCWIVLFWYKVQMKYLLLLYYYNYSKREEEKLI